jgi:hypothetical protein
MWRAVGTLASFLSVTHSMTIGYGKKRECHLALLDLALSLFGTLALGLIHRFAVRVRAPSNKNEPVNSHCLIQ